MVTVDGTHYEAQSSGCAVWRANQWATITGTFDGSCCRIFVDGVCSGEVRVPAGVRNPFDGPLCIGRGALWHDRSTRCLVRSLNVELEPAYDGI